MNYIYWIVDTAVIHAFEELCLDYVQHGWHSSGCKAQAVAVLVPVRHSWRLLKNDLGAIERGIDCSQLEHPGDFRSAMPCSVLHVRYINILMYIWIIYIDVFDILMYWYIDVLIYWCIRYIHVLIYAPRTRTRNLTLHVDDIFENASKTNGFWKVFRGVIYF